MQSPARTPNASQPASIVGVAHEQRTLWLLPGRRLVIGSSPHCDLPLPGPGIAPRHVRLSLRPDGWVAVKTLADEPVRIGSRRQRGTTAIEPGTVLGIGLCNLTLAAAHDNVLVHLQLAWRDARASLHEARRQAPWWTLSLALHALLVWLLLWGMDAPPMAEEKGYLLRLAETTAEDGDQTDPEPVPEDPAPIVLPDRGEVEQAAVPADPDAAATEAGETAPAAGAEGDPALLRADALFDDVGRSRGTKPTGQMPAGVSKTFATDLEKLRATGLEVALLFDSTASMAGLLTDAKRDLREIVELLAELVPSARVGLLTYRDHGDAYVTRQTRLGVSLWEALAFLSSVRADGGGDFEEAVDDALLQASRLDWSTRSRKVIVLAGDAPPRANRLQKAIGEARRFATRQGHVHCLMIGNEPKTRQPFERIAKAGSGRLLRREDRDQLSLQLLELAFGSGARDDLSQLLATRNATAGRRLRVSHLPSPGLLTATLRSPQPDAVIVEAWTQAPRDAFGDLRPALQEQRLSLAGGFALCYLVNMALEEHRLHVEPIEPKPPRGKTGIDADLGRALEQLGAVRRLRPKR